VSELPTRCFCYPPRGGEESYLSGKFLRAQAVGAVGLFGLPAKLPSNSMHWRDIRWYRVLSADTKFQKDTMRAHPAWRFSVGDAPDDRFQRYRVPPRHSVYAVLRRLLHEGI
jgi:hypothetical protein